MQNGIKMRSEIRDQRSEIRDQRKTYIDFLRIIAAFSVIFFHISNQDELTTDVNLLKIFHIFETRLYVGVPLFVMISGVLFLNPERNYNIKKLYGKHIKRMSIAFLLWSPFYALTSCAFKSTELKDILTRIVTGHVHLWFLFMIIGLYMIVPFLLGYTGYFVLGYALDQVEISRKFEAVIYFAGLVSIIFFGTTYGAFSLNSVIICSAIFILCKKHFPTGIKSAGILKFISCHCFGIYLSHSLFIGILKYFGITSLRFNLYISIPTIAILVFIISFLFSVICKKIPVLKNIIP